MSLKSLKTLEWGMEAFLGSILTEHVPMKIILYEYERRTPRISDLSSYSWNQSIQYEFRKITSFDAYVHALYGVVLRKRVTRMLRCCSDIHE